MIRNGGRETLGQEETRQIVTVVGSINFDILFKQSRLPLPGETFEAEEVSFCGGGKGANQAVQIAKLGIPVYLAGAVGKDSLGEELIEKLKTYGVNTEYVLRSEENTGVGVVNFIHDGTLSATISHGANYSITTDHIDRLIPMIEKSWAVIFQLEIPVDVVRYGISRAAEAGCFVVLNASPIKALGRDTFANVDCLVINEVEAAFYLGREIDDTNLVPLGMDLVKNTGKYLVITLGARGSVVFDGTDSRFIRALDVPVAETTGAGDSFIGTLTAMLMKGFDVREACSAATAASSITVQKVGAQEAMPTIGMLQEAYPLHLHKG